MMEAGVMPTPWVFDRSRIFAGLEYAAYEEQMRAYASLSLHEGMTAEEREHLDNAGINLQRATRIARTYTPSESIRSRMTSVSRPQIWMLLSEIWCADSAQCVPYISRIASLSQLVTLRMILRDTNLDIMDAYLTDGKRSIPKLVIFSEEGAECGQWGPRPNEAQQIVDAAIAEGIPKKERQERLHLWYGRNRGLALEAELQALVSSTL